MKIRNGFVSNSSSSSFIIYGNEVKNKTDLEQLLGSTKVEINRKAKKYFDYDRDRSNNAFDYLLNKFKEVKENMKVECDEQYFDFETRKVYEVDANFFSKQLNNENSWFYSVLKDNIYHSLSENPIDYRHTAYNKDSINYLYENTFDSLDKKEKETVGKVFINKAITKIKQDMDELGDDLKIYFVTFCTDDGESEGFDYFFRDGEAFINANVIRDERS